MNNGFRTALRNLVRGQLALDDLWLILPPLALLIILDLYLIRPYDFWWHLRTGQIILETGAIPTVDLFTFTRSGLPWTNLGWLTQAILYLLYRAGGLPLVIFAHALTITAGYLFVEMACLRTSGGKQRAAALATMAAAALSVFNWNIRPQTASFLMFGLLVFILETHRAQRSRIIWTAPMLFALWVNLHGGFIFGLGLLGIYTVVQVAQELVEHRTLGTEARRLCIVLFLALVALSANPAGPLGVVRYVADFFSSGATQEINLEFMPLNIRTVDGMLFIGILSSFLLIAHYRRLTFPLSLVLPLIVFGAYSLYSRRVEAWFGMAAAPAFVLALARRGTLVESRAETAKTRPAANYLLLLLLVLLALTSLPWFRLSLPLPPDRRSYVVADETPVEATRVLCKMGEDIRMFNNMGYGSYVSWACPAIPVFMDTRFELYPYSMWQEYLQISAGQFDWEKTLAKYGINAIFVSKQYEPVLIAAVRASAKWQTAYEDAHQVIFRLADR